MLLVLLGAGCSGVEKARKGEEKGAKASSEAPKVPPEMLEAAKGVLSADAEVLVWGDLARTGKEQFLAIHRLPKTPEGAVPGTNLLRAAILERDGERWKEIFRCDEHLKNENGYLGGTPIAPVNGWRLQYEQNSERGLEMYFTPIQQPSGGYRVTLGVRWNPKVKRYQALNRNYESFLGETSAIDTVQRELRR
jgi:hypothetical protein